MVRRFAEYLLRDCIAGLVVFLVAVPLCLGVALASSAPGLPPEDNVPLIAGILSGIVGGILVGSLSGSHTSVSGPAAGLTAIVATQIAALGSYDAFLLAVLIGGLIQMGMGFAKAGFIAAFVPTSVIKGLLAAIGTILILKQIPHVLGHHDDPEGEMSYEQPDHENTFSELMTLFSGDFHDGAMTIGLLSILFLVIWDKIPALKKSLVPAPLLIVLFGIGMSRLFETWGPNWAIQASHLVNVPISDNLMDVTSFLSFPDFSQWGRFAIYQAGITIALVASLETLLNVEAIDNLDPKQRKTPTNRELVAQGVGNVACGLIGGLPVTSVIVRSSVNVNAGGQTKLAAIVHGLILVGCVLFLPMYLNMIPLSCLAAILLVTGFKLVSPSIFQQLWSEGVYQFVPFVVTLVAIVRTDLIIGVLIGLATSLAFVLNSNFRRPLRQIVEKHVGGDVLRVELANQVSFLNRAAIERTLRSAPSGSHVLLDATMTDYIDPDILSLIRNFKDRTAPAQNIQLSLLGFRDKYQLVDNIQFVDYSTRDVQEKLTPRQIVSLFEDGNERFRNGRQLTRDFSRQMLGTAVGQHPLAAVLSCIDSRTPAEIILDLGLGDIFSIRVAGNILSPKVLGSMEYATAVVGAKLIVVMGHTRCGAVTSAVRLACDNQNAFQATGCQNLETIISEIQVSIDPDKCRRMRGAPLEEIEQFSHEVSVANVLRTLPKITQHSVTIRRLIQERKVALIGAVYDVSTGKVDFLKDHMIETI